MRRCLRRSFSILALMLSACDAPESATPKGAAVVEPPPRVQPLPPPVAATVQRLREIARTGSYRDLARLAEQTPDFRSNNAGLGHAEYWNLKMRTGEFPTVQIERLLAHRHAVEDSSQGKIYIWPWMATLKPDEITPEAAREIDDLVGRGQAEALRSGAFWPGYVLGIREDGVWLYFVSGAG